MSDTETSQIVILGLGPGNPQALTLEAWEFISQADKIYLRTATHPTVQAFPTGLEIISFDSLYEAHDDFREVYRQIIAHILQAADENKQVLYAVPGHPYVAEATTPQIMKLAKEKGIAVKVVDGVSFLEPTFTALEIDPFPRLFVMDALELSERLVPPFPVDVQVVVGQIYSKVIASQVKLSLMSVFPDEHPVKLVHGAGTAGMLVEQIPLYEIDRSSHIGNLTSLYLPPLEKKGSMEAFQEIIARLRAPDGCPWDKEQTHRSLRPNLLEETYEVLTAIDAGDEAAMCEEFGDLLLQIVLHAQIANEDGEFSLADVISGIHEKIVSRHPHVFGELDLDDADGVIRNWEKLKAIERKKHGEEGKGLLGGVPVALSALAQAETYQKRAARVGFDWKDIGGVIDKVCEEVDEIREAKTRDEKAWEIGDLLFSIVNLARWYKIDAESVLREANARFRERFTLVEAFAREDDRSIQELSLDEMEEYWQKAKKKCD